MKQTAVEWFYDQITRTYWDYMTTERQNELFEQAKEMEKERIETAYDKGTIHGIDYPDSLLPLTGEHYYKQTYGGGK